MKWILYFIFVIVMVYIIPIKFSKEMDSNKYFALSLIGLGIVFITYKYFFKDWLAL